MLLTNSVFSIRAAAVRSARLVVLLIGSSLVDSTIRSSSVKLLNLVKNSRSAGRILMKLLTIASYEPYRVNTESTKA